MKKTLVFLTVLLASLALVFANGAKEEADKVSVQSSDGIGTPDKPIQVTYLCKDVDPITDAEQLGILEKAIEEGLAKEGKYIDLVILSAPTGSYKSVVPIAFRTGQISPDIIYFQGGDQPIAQEGLLEDLTPYIESSENVQNILEGHSRAKVTNYPYLLWLAPARVQIPVMREDWFNSLESSKALLENPTVDNYYALFKEMKDKERETSKSKEIKTVNKLITNSNPYAFISSFTIENYQW